MREAGLGLKAATITPEGADDVGSPNRILREEIDGKVIIRTGRRIPGVTPVAGVHHPISVCRMAVGDAYGAEQWREADGRTTRSPTGPSGSAAPTAARSPSTPSATAEQIGRQGLRRPEVDGQPGLRGDAEGGDGRGRRAPPRGPLRAGADRRDLRRAWSPGAADSPLVIPGLNRDGDLLSDLVLPLFGSIAGAESVLLGARRRAAADGGDGRGAPRHGAGAARARTSPTRWR